MHYIYGYGKTHLLRLLVQEGGWASLLNDIVIK